MQAANIGVTPALPTVLKCRYGTDSHPLDPSLRQPERKGRHGLPEAAGAGHLYGRRTKSAAETRLPRHGFAVEQGGVHGERRAGLHHRRSNPARGGRHHPAALWRRMIPSFIYSKMRLRDSGAFFERKKPGQLASFGSLSWVIKNTLTPISPTESSNAGVKALSGVFSASIR